MPSLNLESSFGRAFPRFYILGDGNTDFRLNASQPVSRVYDDVVQENAILKGFPLHDMDRVEVLRSPQGSRFGRNTHAAGPTKALEGYRESAPHSITGFGQVKTYSRGDIDGGWLVPQAFPTPDITAPGLIPFASESADGIPKHKQFAQVLRLEPTAGEPLSWRAGVFLFSEDYKIESVSHDSTAAHARDGDLRVRQKNHGAAVFGAVNYPVTPALKLRGGLRCTRDKKTFNVEDYTASGFRGSSVQGASGFNNQSVAGPETKTSVEAGVKADLFNRGARLSFSAFSL